jgi:hypothetical protein
LERVYHPAMPELRAVWRWVPIFFLIVAGFVGSRIPPFVPATAPNPDTETKPGLALQLPGEGEVPRLLGEHAKPSVAEQARTTAAANTKADYWFIAAYTLLFLSIALLQPRPMWRVGMIAVVLATAAFDLRENSVIERFIADPAHAVSHDVWLPSQGKWFFFFITALFIAALFIRGAKGWWVVAALLALPALAGVAAALTRNRVLLERVMGPLLLALLVAVLLLPFALRRTAGSA